MSGGLGLKKVFKKVFKVVKKIAVPALIAGAVILTGGAAIPGLASLGPTLSGVVSSAGQGALSGALLAAISGKNIIKGATKGAVLGGVTGGVGALTGAGGIGSAAAARGNVAAVDPTAGNAVAQASGGIGNAGLPALAGAGSSGLPAVAGVAQQGGSLLRGIGNSARSLLGNPQIVGSVLSGFSEGADRQAVIDETKRQERNFLGYAGSPFDNRGGSAGGAPANDDEGGADGIISFDIKTGRYVRKAR